MDHIVKEVFVNVVFMALALFAMDIIIIILDKILEHILDITNLTQSMRKGNEIASPRRMKV